MMTETFVIGMAIPVAAVVFGLFVLIDMRSAKRRPPVDAIKPPLVQPRTADVSGSHDYLREACLWLRFIGINLIVLSVVGALLMVFAD